MADRANVHSAKALNDCRAALMEFSSIARASMTSVDSDIHRITQWLRTDRPAYWKHEIRRREDAVNTCRLEIQRKKLIAAPEPASVVFEERQLRKAQARVESARDRLAAVQRWGPIWEREAGNQKASFRRLSDALASDIPNAVADLERMITAIEGYVAMRAPTEVANPATTAAGGDSPSEASSGTEGAPANAEEKPS